MARGFDWLNGMIYGLRRVFYSGAEMTSRDAVNFTGAGVEVTDDAGNGRTTVTIPGNTAILSDATPQGVGTAGDEGAGVLASRADHVHALGFTAVQTALAAASGGVGFNAQKLTNLANGVASSDAATVGQLPAGGVTSVTGTAPIASTGGATPAISIGASSSIAAGSMSAAHYTLLANATSAATVSAIAQRDGAGRMKAVAGVAADDVAVVSQLGGTSRVVALDANDVIEWKLDDASSPWQNTGSGGAAANLAAQNSPYIAMGSIHGDRCVSVNYQDDSALISGNTTVGQGNAGTVHGWVKPAYVSNAYGGTLIAKGEVNVSDLAIYAGSSTADGVGLSVILGTAAFNAYRDSNAASSDGWLQRGVWSHVALTWSNAGVYLFVNGRKGVPSGTCTIPITWAGTKWRIGQGQTYQMNAEYSMWRVCDVVRSDAYIDEVFRRGVGWYP